MRGRRRLGDIPPAAWRGVHGALIRLGLSDAHAVRAAAARALALRRVAGRDAVLRRLYLSAVNMSDVGALALLDALNAPNAPPLEMLVLDGNPAVSHDVLSALDALVAPRRAAAPPREERATGLFSAPDAALTRSH